jgi:hypothetical protein
LRFQLNKLSLVLSLGDEGSRGAAAFLASAAAAEDPMINFGQRQLFFCGRWILVASANDPMKSILVKGNHFSVGDGF